jgi:hypothetical protein
MGQAASIGLESFDIGCCGEREASGLPGAKPGRNLKEVFLQTSNLLPPSPASSLRAVGVWVLVLVTVGKTFLNFARDHTPMLCSQ